MSFSAERRFSNESYSPLQTPRRWSNLWVKNKKALNNVLFTMRLQSLTKQTKTPFAEQDPNQSQNQTPKQTQLNKAQDFAYPKLVADQISLLPDEILLQILSKLPKSQRNSNSLVSKRWLNLQGRLVRSIKVLDWDFLVSGRIFYRFPNLIHVDLVNGCLFSPRNSGIFVSHKAVCLHVDSDNVVSDRFVSEGIVLNVNDVDSGLRMLASGCPNLRKLMVMNASEMGLLSVAEECPTLQELELHKCNDQVLRGIAACGNLQILKLIGNVDGIYGSVVSDVGLTILAQGCKRLVKLELIGCEGSYEGIRAIGQCCQMIEELTLCDHRMEDGWLPALSYCENLKTLRLLSCKSIDHCPGADEDFVSCLALERLHLEKCQLRDKQSLRALLLLCQGVREIVFNNCWGLDNDMFKIAAICRGVKYLSLEGCSLLTIEGLESVILSWSELQSLGVVSCNKIKDNEVGPALSALFCTLKNLKWRPDTKSLLSSYLGGTGMGKKGTKVFKKMCDWKSLPGA